MEPRPCRQPLACDRRARERKHGRDLLLSKPAEVPQLDDSTLTRIADPQLLQRLIQEQQLAVAWLRDGDAIAGGNTQRCAWPLRRVVGPRMVDEDAPHHLRGQAEKVRAILPRHAV